MRLTRSRPLSAGARFFFSRIFPLIFLLVGGATLGFGLRNILRARASVRWPTAPGVIVSSEVAYQSSDEGGGTYHARILYAFAVGDEKRNGTQVAFGDYGSSNPSHARSIVNRYPAGRAVTVAYMSGRSDVCVLEPGLRGQAWFLPGFGMVFFLAGLAMAIGLPRAMRRQREESAVPEADGTPESPQRPKGLFDELPLKKD